MKKPTWDNNNIGGANSFDYRTLAPTKNKGLLAWEVRSILSNFFRSCVYQTLNETFGADKFSVDRNPTLFEFANYILRELSSFEIAKRKYSIKNLIDARLPNLSPLAFTDYNKIILKNLTKDEKKSLLDAYDNAPNLKTNQGLDMIIPVNNTKVALEMIFAPHFYKYNAVGWAIHTQKTNPTTKKKCFDFGITENSKSLDNLVSHLNSIVKNENITNKIDLNSVFGYWGKVFDNPRVFDIAESYRKQNQNNLAKNPQAKQLVPSQYDLDKYAKYDVYGPGKDRLDFLLADFVNDRPITNSYSKKFNQSAQELLLELANPNNKYLNWPDLTKENQKTLNRVVPQNQNQQTQNTQTINTSQFVATGQQPQVVQQQPIQQQPIQQQPIQQQVVQPQVVPNQQQPVQPVQQVPNQQPQVVQQVQPQVVQQPIPDQTQPRYINPDQFTQQPQQPQQPLQQGQNQNTNVFQSIPTQQQPQQEKPKKQTTPTPQDFIE